MDLFTFNFKKKLLKRGYYLVLIVLMFYLFDKAIFLIVKNSMKTFYRNNKIVKTQLGGMQLNKKNYFNTLIMGSSRTRFGIIPKYLYNNLKLIAFSSAKRDRYPKYHYQFYLKYKKKYGKPRFLIYGVDYFMFNSHSNIAELNALNFGSKQNKILELDKIEDRKPIYLSKISNLYKTKNRINTFITDVIDFFAFKIEPKKKGNITPLGISKFIGWAGKIRKDDRKKPSKWEHVKYSPFPGKEGKYFIRLLNELRKDKVRVFIVGLPEYIGTYETNIEQNKFIRDIKNIIKKHSNVTYFNFNSPKEFNLSNFRYFIDGKYGEWNSHLSIYGAYNLTNKLCDKIQSNFKILKKKL